MQGLAQQAMTALMVAVGYFACAVIGTVLSVPPDGFAIIWPATPFLIGVALLLPTGRWWQCALVLLPTHFAIAAMFQPEAPPVVVATQLAGNLALTAATVFAVRYAISPRPRFDTFASLFKFVLIAGFLVPALVNPLILSVHLASGWTDDIWVSWSQWMIAGVFPTITVPPLLVLAAEGRLTSSRWSRIELVLVTLLLFAIGFLSLGSSVDAMHWPALFLAPLPVLLWAAVRQGLGGTCVALLVLAGAIITQALRHQGPFAAHAPVADVLSLQAFLITVSVPLILLAALMDDRRLMQSEADDLRDSLARLRVDERRRIAQELHDSTAQHLVAAILNLTHLKTKILDGMQQGIVEEALSSVREASTEIRTFSYLLNSPHLESEGLGEVLRQYVPGFERRTGVRTSLRISPLADQLPFEHQHALLRIAQEGLGNVHNHARASRVSISLRCITGRAHLVIRDDGVGIESAAGEHLGSRLRLGLGIPGMKARVKRLGGSIHVSGERKGTTIHVAIPLGQPVHLGGERAQSVFW